MRAVEMARYYNINSIVQELGADKSQALPFFHTFSGCDTTSQFHGKGEKSVWDVWKSYPSITASFPQIFNDPFKPKTVQSELFKTLERFPCIIYDKTTEHDSVNDLRQESSRHYIPPTQVQYYFKPLFNIFFYFVGRFFSINVVFGVEVFSASKKYLHLMILAGRMSKTCGGQCGLIYRKQQKPAGNC